MEKPKIIHEADLDDERYDSPKPRPRITFHPAAAYP